VSTPATDGDVRLRGLEPAELVVDNLIVHYGGVQAVRGISFVVGAGESVGIIGANGAGKTSTLRGILGLIPRRAQTLTLGGEDLRGLAASQMVRRGVGYVPEGRHIFPGLPVEKNLLLGAYTRRWRTCGEELGEIYDLFPVLKSMRVRLAGALSGGQQQMLAIGRALMARPRLLVLDEPSMGLSPLLVNDIVSVLQRLHDTGLSILLVEQNAKLTFATTSRCFVMDQGQIVKTGLATELRHDPDVRRIYLGL
jgi:branched-chain amino acid transport system ATP-binding protein